MSCTIPAQLCPAAPLLQLHWISKQSNLLATEGLRKLPGLLSVWLASMHPIVHLQLETKSP